MSSTRYTIVLDEASVQKLAELQKACRVNTRAAVFDLGIVALDWMIQQHKNGYEVGRWKDDRFQPVLLPFWAAETPAIGAPAAANDSNPAQPAVIE